VRDRLKRNPKKGPRITVIDRSLEVTDVPRLYRTADAFVLASHGEGWGRPYMEAMAMELPTIATRWSGNLEFMNDDNSYLIDYKLVDAPADTWMRGQRWAQPSIGDLRRAMRSVYEQRTEAAAIGKRARADVLVSCGPELLVEAVRERLEAIVRRPAQISRARQTPIEEPVIPSRHRRSTNDARRISACVVAQDSAQSLPQCVSSLEDVADAIIVVDAESGEDMAAARNQALDQATGGWVVMVDATNTLDPASVDVVRDLVDQGEFVGYAGRQLHQFGLDGAVSAIQQRTPVLFPRHPDLRYAGRVSEQLLPQRRDLRFRLAPSRIILHEHDYLPDRSDPVSRARRQLPLLERSAREAPDEPFHLFNLGVALGHLELNGEAETTLQRAITRAPRHAIWGPSAHASLSRAVAAQGRKDEAVKLCKVATKLAPDWAQGWCMLGEALVDAGRTKAALRAYRRALKCGGDTWLASDIPDDSAWRIRAGVAKIHLSRGQYEEAAECLGPAVTLNPTNVELHTLLARALEALGRPGEANQHLDRAIAAVHPGPVAYAAFADFFTKKAEDALLRGLADNAESRSLLERVERLRAARAIV
jgi:tetratricopeptide (TPR) repeat protein